MECPICDHPFADAKPLDVCVEIAVHLYNSHPEVMSSGRYRRCPCGTTAPEMSAGGHAGLALHLFYDGVGATKTLTQHILEHLWTQTTPSKPSDQLDLPLLRSSRLWDSQGCPTAPGAVLSQTT